MQRRVLLLTEEHLKLIYLILNYCVSIFLKKNSIKSLKVDGGASANNLLMQIQSDIIAAPVLRPQCVETTAMGAAYLAGLAVGYWTSKEDVIKNWAIGKTFHPSISAEDRALRIKGWSKALTYAHGWAKDED